MLALIVPGFWADRHLAHIKGNLQGKRPLIHSLAWYLTNVYSDSRLSAKICRFQSLRPLCPPTSLPSCKPFWNPMWVLDAIFGFSFQSPVRAPFVLALLTQSRFRLFQWTFLVDGKKVMNLEQVCNPIYLSVWRRQSWVRSRSRGGIFIPKFVGRYFVGIPQSTIYFRTMDEKFGSNLPRYPDFTQIVELLSNGDQKL